MKNPFFVTTVIIALVLALLSSCTFTEFFTHSVLDEPDEHEDDPIIPATIKNFTLPRYSGEEISPYGSKSTANRDIISLCYGALITLDSSLNAVPQICDHFYIAGDTVVFYLDENAVFSDGSHITASDCVYSFAKASAADSVFKNRFSAVSGYDDTDTYVFTVRFTTDNIYNVNLTSIPVIKAGSDLRGVPVGSGPYVFNSDEGGMFLTANKNATVLPLTERIDLLAFANTEELLYNINYGNVHLSYADLSEGSSSFRGTVEIKDFTTNNLLFAVVNRNKEYFASQDAVKGITYALNREGIVSNILSSSSRSVWYPFNPDWSKTKEADLNTNIYSSNTAHDFFNSSALVLSGTQRVWNGQVVELVILVNQESIIKTEIAAHIAENLRNFGFGAVVKTLQWDEMKAAVLAGEYDIFIGETNIFPNMDIMPVMMNELVVSSRTASDEQPAYSEEFLSSISDFYSGKIDMRTFLSIYQEELPFIPLYFSGGALAINRKISGSFSPCCFNLFSDPETWVLEQ